MTAVQHIVLLKLRSSCNVSALMGALAGLRALIPGILSFSAGANTSAEGLSRGYTHGFIMLFESPAARDAYLPHPEHERVKGLVLAELEEGASEPVWVVDFGAQLAAGRGATQFEATW